MPLPPILPWPTPAPRGRKTAINSCRPIWSWSPSLAGAAYHRREDEMIDEIVSRLDLGSLTRSEDPDLGVDEDE